MTKDKRPRCEVCRRAIVLIPGGTCERCKQILRIENRTEYFEVLSWEQEYNERRQS